MKIEVSHESPIQFLDYSHNYNDYDYALVHLFESHPEYYDHFYNNRLRKNRKVYLDNSIFELGESFAPDLYAKWIEKLRPTYYIVPDTLEDADETVNKFLNFKQEYSKSFISCGDTNTIPLTIGVVQGKDWYELSECYKFMSSMADMIAISFDYSYYLFTGESNISVPDRTSWYDIMYNPEFPELSTDEVDIRTCPRCLDKMQRFKNGRKAFIQRLISENIWNWEKPHHLLGCSLANEFRYYVDNNIYNIASIDTSNPIVAALKGYTYQDDAGLAFKPVEKLADMIEYNCSEDERPVIESKIEHNTTMFKKIIRR